MKIKYDYVTNSSSTSFCLYGVSISLRAIRRNIKKFINIAFKNEFIDEPTMNEYLSRVNKIKSENLDGAYKIPLIISDLLELLIVKNVSFNYRIDISEKDIFYIGRSPETMEEDETVKVFKDSTINLINMLGFTDKYWEDQPKWIVDNIEA